MKYHPDRNPNDKVAEEHFKEAREAYEVLSDDRRRSAYDQFGHSEQQSKVALVAAGAGGMNFSDIFGDIFGIFLGVEGRVHNADLICATILAEITLESAVFGKTVEITVPTLVACVECGGNGTRKGAYTRRLVKIVAVMVK